ncbi:MAG: class I SAM-dependent methyltransferase [Candidatus Marinimicrobia bacterium]|nr:class I SAM-dependent methyltransferase [Candidatus Neomarinimicrobiota bacterium]MCF7901987.1 class I SAM-dependent methyltransferase [Candidatus Neomarinimicrobiota bacterium]
MTAPFDYTRYLAIKKGIDDTSLNPEVWKQLTLFLEKSQTGEPPRILEIGGGIGTMIQRLLEADLLKNAMYTAIEVEPDFKTAAAEELDRWCARHARTFSSNQEMWRVESDAGDVRIKWQTGDILQMVDDIPPATYDLIIGHAVVDLLPVPLVLPRILARLKPGAAFYFSLNYAGETRFRPSHPRDGEILRAYHHDMDWRFPELTWQASRTGLHLGEWLEAAGHAVVVNGSSDWSLGSANTADEAKRYFIANILDTIEQALVGLQGVSDWVNERRSQLAAGELHYFAANQDYFGFTRKPYMATRR